MEKKPIGIRLVTASELRTDQAEFQCSNALVDVAGSILKLSRSPLERGTIASDSLVCEGERNDPMKSMVRWIAGRNMGVSTSKSKYEVQDR